MDTRSWFCVVAATVFTLVLLQTLRRGSANGYWFLVMVGTSLYLTVAPVLCGAVLLGCSLALVWDTVKRSELLPVQNRTVLITGETEDTSTHTDERPWQGHEPRVGNHSNKSSMYL